MEPRDFQSLLDETAARRQGSVPHPQGGWILLHFRPEAPTAVLHAFYDRHAARISHPSIDHLQQVIESEDRSGWDGCCTLYVQKSLDLDTIQELAPHLISAQSHGWERAAS